MTTGWSSADLQRLASRLDAVLFDIGGTLVDEAPPATPTADLVARLLPDALADVTAIAGVVRVGAVTNTAVMSEGDVRSLLQPSGLDALLEVVVTSVDVGAAKPDPRPLHTALVRMGLADARRVLYVGDRPTDADAATAAGMPSVDVAGGTVRAAVVQWLRADDSGRRSTPRH